MKVAVCFSKESGEIFQHFGHTKFFKFYEIADGKISASEIVDVGGADVHAKNNDGMTALMYAAQYDAADVAKTLIATGADVHAKDNDGQTALVYAAINKAEGAAKVLIEAGA